MEKEFCKIGIVGKPFIGECSDEWNKNVIVNGNLNDIVYKAGYLPVGILPISPREKFNMTDSVDSYELLQFDKDRIRQQIRDLDGIILQGGMQTLAYEEFIARVAIHNRIPIMGICAGFNTIVRVSGGKVIEDISASHDKEPDELAHSIIIDPDSEFYRLMGKQTSVQVNSVHWMVAQLRGIPSSLRIAAVSPDRLVEVVEGRDSPIYGYKFHPEVMAIEGNKTYNPIMKNIFNNFFAKCEEYQKSKTVFQEKEM